MVKDLPGQLDPVTGKPPEARKKCWMMMVL